MRAFSKTVTRARTLRHQMTAPEIALWALLRRKQQSMRFRRQHPIGPYILDFYCAATKLCVEIDGPVHEQPGQPVHDAQRDAWLAAQGIRVLRIAAPEALEPRNQIAILKRIAEAGAPSTA